VCSEEAAAEATQPDRVHELPLQERHHLLPLLQELPRREGEGTQQKDFITAFIGCRLQQVPEDDHAEDDDRQADFVQPAGADKDEDLDPVR